MPSHPSERRSLSLPATGRPSVVIRPAVPADGPAMLEIYNQGILDRIATLETEPKEAGHASRWFHERSPRHAVLAAESDGALAGWASISPYNPREAYRAVGEISVYVEREQRGCGVGQALLAALEEAGRRHGFHKFVLFTFPWNALGQGLYRKRGYREVGVFKEQGLLDGVWVDVMAMEKALNESSCSDTITA